MELSQVAHTLRSLAGADVQAKGIDVRLVGSSYRVDIVTAQPGRVIGRRGATADQIRSALATPARRPRPATQHPGRPPRASPVASAGGRA